MRKLICDRCGTEYERQKELPEFYMGEYVDHTKIGGRIKDLCPNCTANLAFWFKSVPKITPCDAKGDVSLVKETEKKTQNLEGMEEVLLR